MKVFCFTTYYPSTIYEVVRFHRWANEIAGMTFHRISGQPDQLELQVTIPRLLNFIRLLLMEAMVFIVYSRILLNTEHKDSVILDYGPPLCVAATIFNIIVVTVVNALTYRSFIQMFGKLYAVDNQFEALKSNLDHTAQQRFILRASVVYILILITTELVTNALLVVESDERMGTLFLAFCRFILNTVYLLIFGSHTLPIYLIYKRYQHINHLISLKFDTSNRKQFIWIKEMVLHSSDRIDTIQKLANIHAELTEALDLFCESQWIQLILGSLNGVFFTTFNIFLLYRSVLSGERFLVLVNLQNCLLNVYYAALYVSLVFQNTTVTWEAKKTIGLVYKVLNNTTRDVRMVAALRLVARQLHAKTAAVKLRFNDGDVRVLFSAVGAISTYLVILFQFDQTTVTGNNGI
ncbi:uncharacterized protein LOC129774282 [Toxorhynchites rutilus septentrionalis]|uniref:uncharacterized protein LOC129774282 n=1 Tax=Toxorhynchites rutilus septentrionalis TaxID=329112 RepID=UPI0024798E07|nr:uncharacterized protein LOC129774282 [Toxorhynchites rutilus septentrionalis]